MSGDPTFQPARLTLARQRRGLTKVALADKVGLSSRRISGYENEGAPPPPPALRNLSRVLGYPVEYFYRPLGTVPSPDNVSFRSFSRMTASARDGALASATTGVELASYLDRELHLPSPNLPDLRDARPVEAAAALRSSWGLGLDPAPNLIHLVESHGVRVFSLIEEFSALDAFSLWVDGTPFVFLTRHKSPERGRWDVAHELGHLLLHLETPPKGPSQEADADEFARELLLPERGVDPRAVASPSLHFVRAEKVWWGVSAMAYIRQLHEIGRLSDWQYRSLVIEATQAGYRREEGDIERESSSLLPKALALLAEEGVGVEEIAGLLDVEPSDVRELIFSTVVDVSGGAKPSGPPRGHLRAVR